MTQGVESAVGLSYHLMFRKIHEHLTVIIVCASPSRISRTDCGQIWDVVERSACRDAHRIRRCLSVFVLAPGIENSTTMMDKAKVSENKQFTYIMTLLYKLHLQREPRRFTGSPKKAIE